MKHPVTGRQLIPVLLLLLTLASLGLAGWPANHINSLSDIRCRQWCTFRFREGSRGVFVGRDAEIRRFLIGDYVKRTQDRAKRYLSAEMTDNMRQFRAYYSRGGGGGGGGGSAQQQRSDRTVKWFNLYHDYLHCLRECFDA